MRQLRGRISTGCLHDEDYFANPLSVFQWSLVAARLRRGLHHMVGWPSQLFVLLDQCPSNHSAALSAFEGDVKIFEAFKGLNHPLSTVANVRGRHDFNNTALQQMICGFRELGFCPHDDMINLLARPCRGVCSTQVVEDVIGQHKNTRQIRAQRAFRRPEWSMAAALTAQVLDKIHHYKRPVASRPLPSMSCRLSAEQFRSHKKRSRRVSWSLLAHVRELCFELPAPRTPRDE